jgi:hypothetical protein
MAVNLSPVGGVAAQFFNNDGTILSGGKIYTYTAGTTTNQATYTTSAGSIQHSNPIILNSSGRVPTGEIWLTDGISYKFVLKDSNDVLIATYDNITGINSNFVNFTNAQEIQTATSGQTVFTLTTMQYQPGTNSLSVFVDGVNQYGPGAQYAFTETNSTTVTFVSGLHVGASVKFTTSAINASSYGTAADISFTGFKNQIGNVQNLADDDGSDWIGFEPAGSGAVARSAQDKMRDVVSVKDFGAVGDGVTDDTVAIQAFFDYAQANKCYAIMEGVFKVTSAITSTGGSDSTFYFNATVNAANAMDWVIKFINQSGVYFAGQLQVFGAGASNNYSARLCTDGIIFENCRASRFEKLRVEKFLRYGIYVTLTGNNTLLNLGDVRTHYCGSSITANYVVVKSYSGKINTGSASSAAQRSVITLSSVPAFLAVNMIASKGNEPYLITAISGNDITVYPWIKDVSATGDIVFYIGGGLQIEGDDAASVNFDSLDSTYCGVGLRSASLYGFKGKRLITQFNGVGLAVGNNTSSAYYGNTLESYYTEGNSFDVVKTTLNNVGLTINGVYEFMPNKYFALAPRTASYEYDGIYTPMTSVLVNANGTSYQKTQATFGLGGYTTSYTVTADNSVIQIKGGNTISIALTLDANLNRAFAYSGNTFIVYGRRAGNRVDSVTFTPTDVSQTVMGGASYVISGVTTVLMISAWYDYENTNWVISKFVPV